MQLKMGSKLRLVGWQAYWSKLIKVGAKCMITVNADIQVRLTNGHVGKFAGFDSKNSTLCMYRDCVCKV